MSTPDDPKRSRTDHLFIGGGGNDEEAAPPPPPPARSSTPGSRQATRPSSGHPPIAGRSGARRTAGEAADPDAPRNDSARMITIIAICVGALGLLGLVSLLSGRRTVTIPPPAAVQETVAPTPENPPPPVVVTPPRPKPVPAPSSNSANLLTNASFEQVANGEPVGWHPQTYNGDAKFSVASTARRGRNSACIASTTGADAKWFVALAVKPNTTYLMKGWVKCENLTGPGRGAQLNMEPNDFRSDEIKGTTDWKLLQFTFDTRDRTEVYVNCLYGGWGQCTGTAWFDDIEVVELFSGK